MGEGVFSFLQGGDPRLHARHDRGEAVGLGQTGGDPIRLTSESRQDSFELRRRAERALLEPSDDCLAQCRGRIWFGDLLNARFQANHALVESVDLDRCRLEEGFLRVEDLEFELPRGFGGAGLIDA